MVGPCHPLRGIPLCACTQAALHATCRWALGLNLVRGPSDWAFGARLHCAVFACLACCACCVPSCMLFIALAVSAFGTLLIRVLWLWLGISPSPVCVFSYGVLDCVHFFRGVMFSLPAPTASWWHQQPAGAAGRGCGCSVGGVVHVLVCGISSRVTLM